MRQLSRLARGYLTACYLLGTCALAWLVWSYQGPALTYADWLLAGVLAVAAATCQVLVVARTSTTGQRSDHLTPAPLFAAVLLVPRPLLGLVIIAAFVPEWYVYRRPWYGQLFNIASFLIAATLARLTLFALTDQYRLSVDVLIMSLGWPHVLLAVPVFLGTQTLLLAWVLKLARGQSFRTSGLFSPNKLLVELGLVCVGLVFAIAWIINPFYGLAAALPLLSIFPALHVPNLKEAASTDPKTGLANMRHFNSVLARHVKQAAPTNQPFSVLMCDLDYLRQINNTYGHQAGDAVLLGVSELIRQHLHDNDLAARFGGEEFVVLLADTAADQAEHIAEQLRAACAATLFTVSTTTSTIKATMSIGVATFPGHGYTPEELLHEADLAVYQAKRDGRNRVVVASRASHALASEWARKHFVPAAMQQRTAHNTPMLPFWQFIRKATQLPDTVEQHHAALAARGGAGVPQPSAHQHARSKPTASVPLRALIATIASAGLLGLLPGFTLAHTDWWTLGLLVVLTVMAEYVAVDVANRGKTSVAVVVILSAALLYGPLGIALTALAFAVSVGIKAHSPPHRIIFNFGTVLLAAEGARWSFNALLPAPLAQAPLVTMLVPAIVAGLVFYLINHLLLCLARGLAEQRVPWQVWRADYLWLWPHYVVMGLLGLTVALAPIKFNTPLGIVVLIAPVVMMHVAIKQYMERTTVYVAELQRLNYRLTDSYEATLHALTRALDTRDEETEEHSQRVKRYTQLIAHQLRLSMDEQETIMRGALLHDIGKIGVPDAILLKTAPLTGDERALIRNHPEIGYTMIAHIPFLAQAAQVVLHHHEAYDGSGYPHALSGEQIPLGARIFAVADAYDAMTSDRPYRRALPHKVACAELARCRGTQFDPLVVDTFLSIGEAELGVVQQEVAVFVQQSRVAAGANYPSSNAHAYAVNEDGVHSSDVENTDAPPHPALLKAHYQQS